MRVIRIILSMILALIGVSFAVLNAKSVALNLYVTTWQIPVSLLITIVFGLGLITGFLLFLSRYLRVKFDLLKLKNQLKLTEKEIKNLRHIPLNN